MRHRVSARHSMSLICGVSFLIRLVQQCDESLYFCQHDLDIAQQIPSEGRCGYFVVGVVEMVWKVRQVGIVRRVIPSRKRTVAEKLKRVALEISIAQEANLQFGWLNSGPNFEVKSLVVNRLILNNLNIAQSRLRLQTIEQIIK